MKKEHTAVKYLKSFINNANSFTGISFSGVFNMDIDVFTDLLNHFISTGENLLDEYVSIVHLNSSSKSTGRDDIIISTDVYERYLSALRSPFIINFFPEEIEPMINHINECHERFLFLQSYEHLRKEATRFTQNKEIRYQVFNLLGESCLRCGSVQDIEIDHVISVRNGGLNEISNLQPLCKKCNSSKGFSNTDYRKL